MIRAISTLAFGLVLAACSSAGAPNPPADASTPASNGVTACGNFGGSPKQCIAGQYCSDQTLSTCDLGCLSDVNCASNQQCDKTGAGGQIGGCHNKVPTEKDCVTFVSKCKACNTTLTDQQCQQMCTGVSAACVSCINTSNCGTACTSLCQ